MSEVGESKAPQVPNYLSWAILATIFCCMPLGIVSIVFAAQVGGKLAVGDYPAAVVMSRRAKLWLWIAFWSGLVEKLILLLIVVATVILAARQQALAPGSTFGPGP